MGWIFTPKAERASDADPDPPAAPVNLSELFLPKLARADAECDHDWRQSPAGWIRSESFSTEVQTVESLMCACAICGKKDLRYRDRAADAIQDWPKADS